MEERFCRKNRVRYAWEPSGANLNEANVFGGQTLSNFSRLELRIECEGDFRVPNKHRTKSRPAL